jgi:hypothetical protein
MEAVSAAVVDLVGNSSTHLEKASIITRIYSLPVDVWMSGSNTMTDRRATMRRSAKVGGGGIWFIHNRDKASGMMFLFARNME